ncbi:MAG TPA: tryptophan synthase subunit alpha [Acidimicrobiales bacterium]|nr:tryptophan synthase subunit alpha [Acidimicrobiales bacterium]
MVTAHTTDAREPGALEKRLRARRDAGAKLLVPYIVGGMADDWLDAVHAVADAGADAIEIGIPFSDPVMDGPTIQEASVRALARGTTPASILATLARTEIGVPLAVMTYYNLVFRAGHRRFADALVASGVAGAIVPDLPLEEAGGWSEEADAAGVETVFLVAPSTPDERARRICARSRGFVYGVGLMGVTGERAELAATAREVAGRLRPMTDTPVCIGIGVSTPAQAAEVCAEADGVVVGSALVRRLLDGAGPGGAGAFVAELRAGIDTGR